MKSVRKERILITGPFGQIGSELVPALQERYGKENVIALGHVTIPDWYDGKMVTGDVRHLDSMKKIVQENSITQIYHLASLLSATGESKPSMAWDINMTGLKNVLDLAVEFRLRVFWPSSIAVFGPTTPKENTPQSTVLEPTTMYGVTKLAGEVLCQYYHLKFGVDVRSLRYPGIISWKAEPGGGTTDYAVTIFYDAIQKGRYECFVRESTVLPMMYMDDAIKATLQLMEAPSNKIKVRTSYNLAAISFSAKELELEIQKKMPGLKVTYRPDNRQEIADSWPMSIDDSTARGDWGWKHDFDLPLMTKVMIEELTQKLSR
ncbi:NAD-dependent epimerase/dehydratase family protein [Candidatus Woesearchaeota archaeon]|nr:NAD-dependent epimerase/dehydratase family protein [Candidatus Woesearchaeota archaeon]